MHKNHLTDAVTEKYEVLKTDKHIKQGIYRAFFADGQPLAIGAYNHNVKVGTWTFYDDSSHVIQRYNYDQHKLVFKAGEDTSSHLKYVVDMQIKPGDTTTIPVRIGDRFYGYINYLKLFKLPKDMANIDLRFYIATMQLLVSPGGRLADYAVHFTSPVYPPIDLHFDVDQLSEEDKIFIPATINHQPVACQIFIPCFVSEGQLDFN